MRNSSHGFWLCITAVVAVSVIAVPAASAGVDKYDTELEGHREGGFYHGVVQSVVHKCERRRLVILFEQRPGADRKVGTNRSDRDGSWNVNPPQPGLSPSDRFYTEVTRKSGDGWVCRADRAPNHGVFEFLPST